MAPGSRAVWEDMENWRYSGGHVGFARQDNKYVGCLG